MNAPASCPAIRVAATILLLGFAHCAPMPSISRSLPGTITTIIMARHAERDPGSNPPPTEPLNAEGLARAAALADALDNAGITAIYVAGLTRNLQTVEPLVGRINVDPTLVSPLELLDTKALADQLANTWLTRHAGGVVLWVGNTGPVTGAQSGNLQEIYMRLGGTNRPPTRYQDLYFITIDDQGRVAIDPQEYGGPSSQD